MTRKISLITLIILGTFCISFPKETTLYSLQDCYQMALSRSEILADQQELVKQTEERYMQTVGALLPSITSLASYTIAQKSVDQSIVKANATYPLFRGFQMVGAIKQNQSLLKAQTEAKQWASLQLYSDVSQAVYLYAYLLQDNQLLLEEKLLFEKRLKELKDRVTLGRSRETEVYSMNVSLIQLKTQLIQTQSQISSAESLLQFLTGMDTHITLSTETPIDESLVSLNSYVAKISNRPDIKAATHRLESSKIAEQITLEGESTPQVDLNGNLYLINSPQNNVWDAQIKMTLPNFLGDVAQSKTRESSSIKKQLELALSLLQRKSEEDIKGVYVNLVAEKQQIELLESAQNITQKSVDAVIQDYRRGQSNNLDVLQAMTTLTDMKRSLNKMKFAYKTNYAQLIALTADIPTGIKQ